MAVLLSLAGVDVIDDRLDAGRIENPVLVAPDQIGDGYRCGDFMAQHPVQIEHVSTRKRFVPQMGGKYFFSDGLSHDSPNPS